MQFKILSLSVEQIYMLLKATDQSFVPFPISKRIELDSYAEKLAKLATHFVCIQGDRILGLCACYLNDGRKEKAFISITAVLPEYQGKGIGKVLTRFCEKEACDKGFDTIEFEVNQKNIPSIKMHESIGYCVLRKDNDSLFMVKTLIARELGNHSL